MNAFDVLEQNFGEEISSAIINAYQEIEKNFVLGKWKVSELDAGHFVEAVRRLIEQELFGTYTSFSDRISNFTDSVLVQYENVNNKDESYRILIPRVLKAIYGIRNKRGVAHITKISPNKMDSTFILYSVKWILAELIRLNSGLAVNETQDIVDQIVEREIGVLWKTKNFTRLLTTKMSARKQVLILLFDKSPLSDVNLQNIIEYKNTTNFQTILNKLHGDKLLFYQKDGFCHISPLGQIEAEMLLQKENS